MRSILEAHSVPYGVDSQEGEGTTFWFQLPLRNKPKKNGLQKIFLRRIFSGRKRCTVPFL